jgi:Mg-chelatase subunit ChlD
MGRDGNRCAVTVQATLLAAGSLEAGVVRQLMGRPGAARRYLAVEGGRVLAANEHALPGLPALSVVKSGETPSASPEESLRVAFGRRPVGEAPEAWGVIRPRRLLTAGRTEATSPPTPEDLARTQLPEQVLPETDADEETESVGKIAKLFSAPLRNPLTEVLMKRMGLGREAGSGPAGGELAIGGARLARGPGSKAGLSSLPASLLPTEVASEMGGGWRYPEWDVHSGSYRVGWCTVRDVIPSDRQPFELPPTTGLQRRLGRLGVGLQRCRRQPQGDDIDIDAVVEVRAQARAGCSVEEGVYVDSQRRRRSLAVLVLLDVSGSVADASVGAPSAHEQQRQAAGAFVDALHRLGDRVALYGFRSRGRSAVRMVQVKSFNEVTSGLAYERLGALAPGSYTRLGAAIRHSAHLLDTQAGTDHRLLLVLSDGFPYDDGYEGPYARADARRALAETRRQGIGCLCLTLGASTGGEELRRVFGTSAHASAGCLEDLAGHIGPLFRRALASADMQRRLAQRHRAATTKGEA